MLWLAAALAQDPPPPVEPVQPPEIGALIKGDANDDTDVNTGDIGTVITEFFNGGLAPGTPDCNEDGLVNTGDIGCVITIFFSS